MEDGNRRPRNFMVKMKSAAWLAAEFHLMLLNQTI
jgi:hypothetical protein